MVGKRESMGLGCVCVCVSAETKLNPTHTTLLRGAGTFIYNQGTWT